MPETNGVQTDVNQVAQVFNEQLRLYQSALGSRAEWANMFGKAFGGKRDYYETLGYDHHLSADKYHARFERQDIASRIVSAYPDETWRLSPKIYEDEAPSDTAFETAWALLAKQLRIFHHMHRADILACVGRFSVLFLGFNDVTTVEGLARPVAPRAGRQVQYLSSYGERHVEIVELDNNLSSPRFGLPLIYEIDFDRGGGNDRGVNRTRTRVGKRKVSWDRVIHLADDVLEDDVYGIPKLRPVYNLLDDMLKIVGGGGETFWRNARKDLIVEVNPDAHLSTLDRAAMRDRVEEYMHDYQRFLGLEGATGKALPVEIATPDAHFNCIIQLISGTTGIPARILLGSERGELASSQDAVNWAQQNMTRQQTYAEPTILRPFIDRLIDMRVLPTPRADVDGYTVEWQPLMTEDEAAKSDRILKWTQAISTFANGAASSMVPLAEYRKEILGWDEESPYEFDDELDARESQFDDELEEPGPEAEPEAEPEPSETESEDEADA